MDNWEVEHQRELNERRAEEIRNKCREIESQFGDTTNNDTLSLYMRAFREGVEWAEKTPSTNMLLQLFKFFEKHGLIRDDLCFDPEHFMETVVKVHWRKWLREKQVNRNHNLRLK